MLHIYIYTKIINIYVCVLQLNFFVDIAYSRVRGLQQKKKKNR